MSQHELTIASLWRYPVKSMAGERLGSCAVTARGLQGDRAWAVRESATDRVATAKNPRLWPRILDFQARTTTSGDPPAVEVTFPDGKRVSTSDPRANAQLSSALGVQLTLSAAPGAPEMEMAWPDESGAPDLGKMTLEKLPPGTFFDLAQVHLVTTASLEQLASLAPGSNIAVRRFRPNIVVSAPGLKGFAEGAWVGRTVVLGDGVRLQITQACPRCVMTTLAQGDLPADHAVLRTIARQNEGAFGVYASVLQGGGLREGDTVRVE